MITRIGIRGRLKAPDAIDKTMGMLPDVNVSRAWTLWVSPQLKGAFRLYLTVEIPSEFFEARECETQWTGFSSVYRIVEGE